MTDLLQLALDAHGGLRRWSELNVVETRLSIDGALWHVKKKEDLFSDIQIHCKLREQRMATRLLGQERQLVFTPDREFKNGQW